MDRKPDVTQNIANLIDDVALPHKNKFSRKKNSFIIACVSLVIGLAIVFSWAYTTSNKPVKVASGQITEPKADSHTYRKIKIAAFTENVPQEYPFILVAVDVPKLNRMWPKAVVHTNTRFKTSFLEEGPNEKVIISIYAIDPTTNAVVHKWFKDGKISGIPMLPEKCRLDSIVLKLI